MNLQEQFQKETGLPADKFSLRYVEWLEAKVREQRPEADFSPQAIAAFNRMLANEQCGGTGWWSGWEALKTALWKLQP